MLVQVIYCNYLHTLLHLELLLLSSKRIHIKLSLNQDKPAPGMREAEGSPSPPACKPILLCLQLSHTAQFLQLGSLSMKQRWSGGGRAWLPP